MKRSSAPRPVKSATVTPSRSNSRREAQNAPISLPLPLNDFAKAYDGRPTDLKVFLEQQRKLQKELQKQQKEAEETRKKLEGQQIPAPAAAPPAALAPEQKK